MEESKKLKGRGLSGRNLKVITNMNKFQTSDKKDMAKTANN